MLKKYLVLYKIIILLFISTARAQVGNSCELPVTGRKGVCKLVNECNYAIELHAAGIDPTICGRYYNQPIVCCEEENPDDDIEFHGQKPQEFVFPGASSSPSNSKRISSTKCKEYSRLLVHVVQAIPLVTNPKPIIAEVPKCDFNRIPLIVGGSPADAGEFPHMALLGYQNGDDDDIKWNCGGTLISEQYVLTAAHCAYTHMGEPVVIRLGELNLASIDDGAEPIDFRVAKVIKHERYKLPEKYNDIALLQLAQTVEFNKYMRPACLWTDFNIHQNKTIATGWGHKEYGGTTSDTLQKVALDIFDNSKCGEYYSQATRQLPRGIDRTMMCVGSIQDGKDTCQGDSGGPIQIANHDNQCIFYIVGVTSLGRGCGAANSPAIYTRVSEYLDWIEKHVWS